VGNLIANYRVCVKWKEAKASLGKLAPERSRKLFATDQTVAPKAQRAFPSAQQIDMGEVWYHVVRGGDVVKSPTIPSTNTYPCSPPQPATESPSKRILSAYREMPSPSISETISSTASKWAARKFMKEAAAIDK